MVRTLLTRKGSMTDSNAVESDYTILAWRQKSPDEHSTSSRELPAVLHLHNPAMPLPSPPSYRNPSFYTFKRAMLLPPSRSGSIRDTRSVKSGKSKKSAMSGKSAVNGDNGLPKFKKDFMKFHNENGVRTISGSIGPIRDG